MLRIVLRIHGKFRPKAIQRHGTKLFLNVNVGTTEGNMIKVNSPVSELTIIVNEEILNRSYTIKPLS